MAKNKVGRPTVMTQEVVDKLEQAFSMGCSDLEACIFADISKHSLYNYQKENPKFKDRKEQLKENPALLARTTIYNNISSDPDVAKWYLERKKKDEFSLKTESANTNINNNSIVYIEKEEKESINKAIDDIVNGD